MSPGYYIREMFKSGLEVKVENDENVFWNSRLLYIKHREETSKVCKENKRKTLYK